MVENTGNQKRQRFYLILSLLINLILMGVLFGWIALVRNVDGDEGLYLEAARLVSEGKILYYDFFFQQMPLLPYIYSSWFKIVGFGIFEGRALSVLLSTLSGGVLLAYVGWKSRNILLMGVFSFLFFANGLVFAWAPVVKTHPINMLCLTLAAVLFLVWKNQKIKATWLVLLAGIAMGIGVNSRLTLAPFLIFFFFYILFLEGKRGLTQAIVLTIGVLIPSIPTFWYFLKDPGLFLRYNLTYHTQIFPGIAEAGKRIDIATKVLFQAQTLLLVIFGQGVLLWKAKSGLREFLRSDTGFLSMMVGIFIAVHMASAEPFTQYFSAMVPLLLLLLLPLFQKVAEQRIVWRFALLGPIIAFYLVTLKPLVGFEIGSMGTYSKLWKLNSVLKTSRLAGYLVKKGEPCLTWWPGYAFIAGCPSVPGMENHMRNHAIEEGIPGEVIEEYKMMSDEQLSLAIFNQEFPIIIEGVYKKEGELSWLIDYLIQENYQEVVSVDGVNILIPKRPKLEKSKPRSMHTRRSFGG